MKILSFLICLAIIVFSKPAISPVTHDYQAYHAQINTAEKYLSEERFQESFDQYMLVFASVDFVFLRDYKVAAQLAFHLGEEQKAFDLIEKGIKAGWILKDIKQNDYLAELHATQQWAEMEEAYPALRGAYLESLKLDLREQVHQMFKKDQRKAFGALFRIGDKARDRYAIKKFAPHSQVQIQQFIKILETCGYPGEQLIGNDFWMSTILSHHNSIATDYVNKDTVYDYLRPKLLIAVKRGQLSPYEFALIDDWYITVSTNGTQPGYGFLNPLHDSTLVQTNAIRKAIGLRSIELRNALVKVEEKTGMRFYLPDWVEGEIEIE